MNATSEAMAEVRAYQAARKPNPLAIAHAFMVQRLAALQAPRIYTVPDPEEFEAAAEYLLDVARIVDECLLSVGREVKQNATTSVDLANFEHPLRDALEGFAIFSISNEVDALKAERAA